MTLDRFDGRQFVRRSLTPRGLAMALVLNDSIMLILMVSKLLRGDERGAAQWAGRIAAGDPRHAAFDARLLQTILGKRSKAFFQLVKRYREDSSAS